MALRVVTPVMLVAVVMTALLVQQGSAQTAPAKTYTIEWIERATPFANVTACKNNNDKVVFTWDDEGSLHNIVRSNSTGADICDKPIRPDLQGFAEAATYNLNITALAPGNYGYICTVGDHCTMGNMNVVVIVKNC